MRERTDLICPLSGGNLEYTGATANDLMHFYESDKNKAIRYKRYRLDWSIFELSNGQRFFHLDGNLLVEVQKVGDKWLTLNATEEDKEKARQDHSKRMLLMLKHLNFPTVTRVAARTIGSDIEPVIPKAFPSGGSFFLKAITTDESDEPVIIDQNARPNISPDECPLVEYITGKIGEVNADNIEATIKTHPETDVQIGDTIYAWDMGGWGSLSGRAGEAIFRGDEYITSRLIRMS